MAKTPSISMEGAFGGSFEAEGSVYQYHAVIAGSDDHQIKEMTTGAAGEGTPIAGVAQYDALTTESVKVVYFGPTWGYAAASITRLNALAAIYSATAAENGRFAPRTDGNHDADEQVPAIALEDAASGERFKLLLTLYTCTEQG
jgi:hypothetical protein